MSKACTPRPPTTKHQLNQTHSICSGNVQNTTLTSSSWWRWRRRWRGRSTLSAAATSAWGRCRCPLRRRSALLSSPSTWRRRRAGKAGWREGKIRKMMWDSKSDRIKYFRMSVMWVLSGNAKSQHLCVCVRVCACVRVCVAAGSADWEYVRGTSVDPKCANSYFPQYLGTLEPAKPCVHYVYSCSLSEWRWCTLHCRVCMCVHVSAWL